MKIRKLLTLALAAALMSASALAAPTLENVENVENGGVIEPESTELVDTLSSTLLYYQDFDNLEPGVYTDEEIASLLPGQTSKLIGASKPAAKPTLEICEEADGNRYLKVTGSTYQAFMVDTGITDPDYMYMYCNYMTDENAYPTEFDSNSSYTSTQYAAEGAGWATDTLSAGKTTWTRSGRITTGGRQNTNIGLGFNQHTQGTASICIDDVAVYSINANVNGGTVHISSIPATFTFKNSTAYESADITMPSDVKGIVWANYYGAQSASCMINLNNYKPTGAPEGKEFAGWSLTDGGKVIHSAQANNFRVPGDLTFYAVWKKVAPVVKFEDFESFTVGQTVTRDDFDFLNINQHYIGDVTATIVLDELSGSKVLKIDSPNKYAGFAIKNRPTMANAREYLEFDFRYDTEDGSRFVMYAGTDHTGGNHKGEASRDTKWNYFHLTSNTSNKTLGGYFDNGTSGQGNFTIYIDNVYYWVVPTDAETEEANNVMITFANSTTNAPTNVTLPKAQTKALYVTTAETYINLNSFVPTTDEGYRFVGWSRTDGGKVIATASRYSRFNFIRNETLYAVWEKLEAPELTGEVSIRTNGTQGIRFRASAASSILNGDNVEIGFLVTRAKFYSDESFTLENVKDANGKTRFVSGAAYEKADGVENVNRLELAESGNYTFAAVLIGIPESKENYTEQLYIRPYVKYGGVTLYGAVMHKSLYEVADLISNSEGYTGLDFVERILEVCDDEN